MKERLAKKKKLPSIKTARNKADSLLTPLVKKLHPNCILCSKPTEVGHHHVHKSKSTALRYDLNNLIPLCNSCHFKLHQNESYWAGIIIQHKGIEWFDELVISGEVIVKADVHFYLQAQERLSAM